MPTMAHFFHINKELDVLNEAKEVFGGRMALNSQKSVLRLRDPLTALQSEVENDQAKREFKTLPFLWFS